MTAGTVLHSRAANGRTARMAVCLMIAFAAAWALLEEELGSRLGGRYDLLQVVWCRYAAHLAILLVVWGWRDPGLLVRTRRPVFQLTRSLLMFVMPYSFVLSVYYGHSVNAVWAVFWFSPLLVLAGAWLGLRERIPLPIWLSTGLATVAALVILRPPMPSSAVEWALPFLMALSFSLYIVMTRSLRFESLTTNLFYTAAGVLMAMSPFMPAVWKSMSVHDALVLFGIGAVGLLALAWLDVSVANAPLSVSAPVLHLQLVFVLILSHRGSISLLTPDLVVAAVAILAVGTYAFLNAGTAKAWRAGTA